MAESEEEEEERPDTERRIRKVGEGLEGEREVASSCQAFDLAVAMIVLALAEADWYSSIPVGELGLSTRR